MMRLRTPSRLHFGLLAPQQQQQQNGRAPGGIGLMVRDPGIVITMQPAKEWNIVGPRAERARTILDRLLAHPLAAQRAVSPQLFVIEHAPLEHIGLGTGTQLSLALARLLWSSQTQAEPRLEQLVHWTGRGQRSAIGAYGFERGGLIVEAGKAVDAQHLSVLITHLALPVEWRILLCIPEHASPWSGEQERSAFAQLPCIEPSPTPRLCQLILQQLLPSVVEGSFDAFAAAVYEYNRVAGEWYRAVQGGVYANAHIERMIDALRAHGCHGAIQTSWGPTVAGFVSDTTHAQALLASLQAEAKVLGYQLLVTQADNLGANLEHLPAP